MNKNCNDSDFVDTALAERPGQECGAAISGDVAEGDWQMVQLAVRLQDEDDQDTEDIDEWTNPYWLAPFAATASQHFYGQTLKWEEEDGDNPPGSQDQDYIEKSGAFQPVIYVAGKGHATYFRAGSFTAKSGSPANPQPQYGPPGFAGR